MWRENVPAESVSFDIKAFRKFAKRFAHDFITFFFQTLRYILAPYDLVLKLWRCGDFLMGRFELDVVGEAFVTGNLHETFWRGWQKCTYIIAVRLSNLLTEDTAFRLPFTSGIAPTYAGIASNFSIW